MIFSRDYEANKPRHDCFCYMDELESGESEGTYVFKDDDAAAQLGDHSSVIVTDSPGLLLFYNATTGELKPW